MTKHKKHQQNRDTNAHLFELEEMRERKKKAQAMTHEIAEKIAQHAPQNDNQNEQSGEANSDISARDILQNMPFMFFFAPFQSLLFWQAEMNQLMFAWYSPNIISQGEVV